MSHSPREANETDPLLDARTTVASSSRPAFSLGADTQDPNQATTKEDKEKEDGADSSISHRSGSIIDGLEGTESSLYEKKCMLIDREIDAIGMGRYQWTLWSLCGLGYLIDLMWAQAFGLILSPMQQELGFGTDQTGKLSTAFSVGLTAGAFVWGVLVDVIGRRWAFNLTVFIAASFGLCIAIPDTYTPILVLAAFTGFGVGGNIPIDTTITLEHTPQSKRYLLPLLSVFQPIGVVICSVLAYGFIPTYSCSPNFSEGDQALPACSAMDTGEACCTKASNMGWRYLLFTLGSLSVLIFILRSIVFDFQESPKFLVYRGKDAKAIEVLQNVAKYNNRTCSLTFEDLEAIDREIDSGRDYVASEPLQKTWADKLKSESRRFKLLFSDLQMTRLTLLVWLTYICDYWGFTVAGKPPSVTLVPSQGLTTNRYLSSSNTRPEEWRPQTLPPLHLPLLHHHLPPRHHRRPAWHAIVPRTPGGSQIHNGLFITHDEHFDLPVQLGEQCCVEYRFQCHGVLLPEHVQCSAVWMDSRSLSSTDKRHGMWNCEFLG